MIDLDKIDIKNYEFSGEELGELLLASVKQMKAGEVAKEYTVTVNEAVQARRSIGLSQKEFAKIMGVSVRTLQAWEQGQRKPSTGALTLLKIATHYPKVLLAVL